MKVAILCIIVLAGYAAYAYNALISLRTRARNAWADIDVQLKRRHDLVPNLLAVVKGYASHEKAILEDVTRLRAQALERQSAETEDGLANAINSLFAVAESYPQLRADGSFRDLQKQLTEVEDNIQSARRYYNAVVRDLNTKCEVFPSNLIAGIFGFQSMTYFSATDEERAPVKARFGRS